MAEIREFDYVIVGGGIAGAHALITLAEEAPDASIALFSAEKGQPVYRPILTKDLWLKHDTSAVLEENLLVSEELRKHVHLNEKVAELDPSAHTLTLASGEHVKYGKLLLATGMTPVKTDLRSSDRVAYVRTYADFEKAFTFAQPGTHIVVVGGSYIAAEAAAALAQQDGVAVTLVSPTVPLLSKLLPPELSEHVTARFEKAGISIMQGRIAGGDTLTEGVRVQLEDGTSIGADAAVIGVGAFPNVGLAKRAGIHLDEANEGVRVNGALETSHADVYAAGDIAAYEDFSLGVRRVEHADQAERMGIAAARSMTGADVNYRRTPLVFSDLFEDGFEAVGEVSTEGAEVLMDGDAEQAIIYYVKDGHVRGVMSWNTYKKMRAARELLRETASAPISDLEDLRGRIEVG